MYIYSAVLVFAVGVAVVDYVMKPKVIHSLVCVLSQVVNSRDDTTTDIKRQLAIDNNYTYSMKVYNNGTLIVNAEDHYMQEVNNTNSYQLDLKGQLQPDFRFQFTKAYDDVVFYIKKTDVKYEYNCKKEY